MMHTLISKEKNSNKMKTIKTVGVVGAGTMGSALAQKFAQEGFIVILADIEIKFIEKGLSGIKTMLNEGVKKKVFTSEQVNEFLLNIKETDKLSDLKVCDIIIEAVFEDFKVKENLFKDLSNIVPKDTILATNTSSFSIAELSASVINPERFIGLHYFYHAAKNRLVEIIPGKKTSPKTIKSAYRFSVLSGKDPIYSKDAYGFAVNRFFVPWLNEAVKLLEEGIGTIEQIDSVCMKTFGIEMGPFALMNATGVPVTLHAQRTLEFFGPSYTVAKLLKSQVEKKENWKIGYMDISMNTDLEKHISERMLGCVFFVCSQILEEDICTGVDLHKGAKIGLRWRKCPIDLMKQFGEAEVKRLVLNYVKIYNEPLPRISPADWKIEYVTIEKSDNIAIITINRPEELNALNEEVVKQLDERFLYAENDSSVKTIFITGTGKAFVAGADIKYFVENIQQKSIHTIMGFTRYAQNVFERIDNSPKKIVAVVNGLALGGGLELALCADFIVATPNAMFAFPETGIGIYPGLGGTFRAKRKIGMGLAKYLIYTGKMLSSTDALEIGLCDALLSRDKIFLLFDGNIFVEEKKMDITLTARWKKLNEYFENNPLEKITTYKSNDEEIEKLKKIVRGKAPLALKTVENLMSQKGGSIAELDFLPEIFSSADALLGLTSIGKKVEFQGR